jgi:lipopolysaccharide/colanic/teichoic acid biosynthesis glycosyltransferase
VGRFGKIILDRVAALIGLVVLAPMMAAVALGTWPTIGRPILFRQKRAGRDGVPFTILKFRRWT